MIPGNRTQYGDALHSLSSITDKEKIPADSDQSLKLYDNVILSLKDLVNAKKLLLQVNDSKKEIDMLNEQIKAYESENKDLLRDLEMARQLSRRGSN